MTRLDWFLSLRLFLRIAAGAMAIGAWTLGLPAGAQAHPHVWVTSQSELVYAPDGKVMGVRHAWTFDEMFSTFALQGLETKTKGVYTREELAPLAETNVTSLKEFGFFTFAKVDGKKEKFEEPKDYYLEHKNNLLVLHFTLPLKAPVKSRDMEIEVYDPSYFVDFQFGETDPIKLSGAPDNCKAKVERAGDNATAKQKISEEVFAKGDNSNYGAIYASKIFVTCQ